MRTALSCVESKKSPCCFNLNKGKCIFDKKKLMKRYFIQCYRNANYINKKVSLSQYLVLMQNYQNRDFWDSD